MEKGGLGAGAGAAAAATIERKGPNLETFKAAIRYVLNKGNTGQKTAGGQDIPISIDNFLWKTEKYKQILYRGQCSKTTKDIPVRGTNPLEISLSLEPVKAISTSRMLTDKIEGFACYGGGAAGAGAGAGEAMGRLFEIHLMPGLPFTTMYDQIPEGLVLNPEEDATEEDEEKRQRLLQETFGVVQEEMDEENGLKETSLDGLRGLFFNLLNKEKEVLLDPRKIQFVKAVPAETPKMVRANFKSPETWDSELQPRLSFDLDRYGALQFKSKKNEKAKVKPKWWEEPEKFVHHMVSVYATCAVAKRSAGGGRRRTVKRKGISKRLSAATTKRGK
jgi:hypothetical protein